jgi:hypothetical protein
VSNGVDLLGLYRRTASYLDRILKGGQPADPPVQQPTQYELRRLAGSRTMPPCVSSRRRRITD